MSGHNVRFKDSEHIARLDELRRLLDEKLAGVTADRTKTAEMVSKAKTTHDQLMQKQIEVKTSADQMIAMCQSTKDAIQQDRERAEDARVAIEILMNRSEGDSQFSEMAEKIISLESRLETALNEQNEKQKKLEEMSQTTKQIQDMLDDAKKAVSDLESAQEKRLDFKIAESVKALGSKINQVSISATRSTETATEAIKRYDLMLTRLNTLEQQLEKKLKPVLNSIHELTEKVSDLNQELSMQKIRIRRGERILYVVITGVVVIAISLFLRTWL